MFDALVLAFRFRFFVAVAVAFFFRTLSPKQVFCDSTNACYHHPFPPCPDLLVEHFLTSVLCGWG